MKKIILFFLILSIGQVFAAGNCFLAKENHKILKNEGDSMTAYPPESTFKIALSLMGFDSGIFNNENNPSWSRPEGVDPYINVCKSDHNPHTWMRDSCVWYSQILTMKLGKEKLQNYVSIFAYGNKDLSGGVTSAWLSSSLKISPNGQTEFLQKLVDHQLPVSQASYENTKKIMFIQEMPGGWMLYGKTGTGKQLDKSGGKTDRQHGWFVGYLEKNRRKIVFANHIVDREKQNTVASYRARNDAFIKLYDLINEIEP